MLQERPHVLLVEDQSDLAANLVDYLATQGFTMDAAPDGVSGLHLAVGHDYDAIVLDLTLPRMDGLTLCQRLRREARKATPVIMLTARDTLDDKLAGFAHGADDYLVKPFALPELAARLRALILRARSGHQKVLTVGDLIYDLETVTVERAGRTISLNQACRTILEVLMRHSPRAVARAQLQQVLWGDEPPDSDSLRSHIYAVRKAIDTPFETHMLCTIRGHGYRLVAPKASRR